MIVVGPKQNAKAYMPNAADVPLRLVAQFARHMDAKTPIPQKATVNGVRHGT